MASINSVTIDLKVRGEATATKSLKDFAKANEKVGTNVVGLANKVSAGVKEFSKLDAMHKQGIITENARRKAQAELARQMSVLTGLTEAQARAALRMAEFARKDAEEARRQNAERQRAKQSYDQLLASINPTIAAQQRLRQTQKMLRDAVAAGAITTTQAAAALRQYQAAAQAAGAAGQMTARRTNQLGVLFQQTGYQVGDFAVQVQSGTDFMVALGQQATQLVGTFAMLSRSTRNIAIFSALGVAVPILTAVGAGFTRSGEAANIFADIVENRLGSLEPVFRGLGNLAKLLSDAFEPLGRVSVENLDRLLVAGTLVAGFFAGKFIASTNLATAAVGRLRTGITALGISIQLAGVRATAAMVAMGALTAVLTRIVLPLAAVYAATEGVMFVIRQFRKEAEDASQTDLESTLERLAKGGIEVDKVMDALNDSVSAYRDATDDALQTNEELTESFGRQASAMERLFEQRRKLAEIEARGAAADALNIGLAIDDESVQRFIGNVDKISENYDKLKKAIGGDDDISPTRDRRLFALSQQVTKFAETLNLTKIGALEFAGAIKSAQEAAASGDTERMANAVQNLYDTLNAALLPGAELSEQMRSYLQSLVGGEIILREFLALQEESADATGRSADELIRQVTHQMQIATLQKEINDGANEIVASRDAELQRLENQTRINNLILKHGEDSNQVTEAKLALEREIFKAKQIENNILGKNLKLVMDAYDAYVASQTAVDNVADSTGKAAYSAKLLADALRDAVSAMSGLASFSASLDKALAVSVAKVDALRRGANAAVAGQITGMRVDLDRRMQEAVSAGVDRSIVERMYGGERGRISQLELSEQERVRLQEQARGGTSGAGAEDQMGIGSLAQSLLTEQEKIDMWYEESLVKLEEFNAKELKILGGHAEARLRIESEYQSRILDLQQQQYQGVTTAQQRAMGAFQGFMSTIAGQSEGAAKAVLVINTALSISQAIQNTAVAATRALAELGPVLGPPAAAKIKMYGAAQVGLIAANAALRFAGSGSGGGGGAIGGGIGAPASPTAAVTSQAPAAPQRVIIEGLDRDSLISGEQLQNIFDKLYEENEDRGFVFQVAR